MDAINSSVNRPPVLDGSNYHYWKIRIRTYIKSIKVRAWKSVLEGYVWPTIGPDADGDVVPKPETQWTGDDFLASSYNEKALNAIFSHVDPHMFKLIQNCTTAKQAWDLLQNHCEGDNSIKQTKLQLLWSKFENLRMAEEETIDSYFDKLLTISNDIQLLGDAMSNKQLIFKAVRTLSSKFDIK